MADYATMDEAERRKALKATRAQLAENLQVASFAELAEIKSSMGAREFHKVYRPVVDAATGAIHLHRQGAPASASSPPTVASTVGRRTSNQDVGSASSEAEDDGDEDDSDASDAESAAPEKVWQVIEKRSHKIKPQEVTSKRRVDADLVPKGVAGQGRAKKRMDPRFDPLCGELRPAQAQQNYKFLAEYQDEEIGMIKKQLKREKKPERREELEQTLARLVGLRASRRREELRREVLRAHRKEDLERVRAGAMPFYLRNKELRKRIVEQDKEGLTEGQKRRYDAKREKRRSIKEMKRAPVPRTGP
ncbi:hypothetical protein CXG81DRAFT_18550 [Caulochytrium protostelioides]|uniref:rRNA biogenesis protein RRP36 n=1 Tax=Caulochytrium protostelioides TaxID=1555241 RepID=A0A4P9X8R9_9FUNG|nr:hypothetical protein CXG81DRAFT_18550 [Caulochytrium protostelioides]|eukprot:RKP01668.1 hypothetical protein CXG81DRAFT_18550 [Caulochytrium protostelioides]